MRRLTKKQILTRLFLGFFTIGSVFYSVNTTAAGTYGTYKVNDGIETDYNTYISLDDESNNKLTITLTSDTTQTSPTIHGGKISSSTEVSTVTDNYVTINAENENVQLNEVY